MADMITGYGVAESVKHYYQVWKQESLQDKKATIQGFGNVGAATAFFLAQQGVMITGIFDITGALIKEEGLVLKKSSNCSYCEKTISSHIPI